MNNETKVNIDGKKFLIKLKDAERWWKIGWLNLHFIQKSISGKNIYK